MGRPKGRKSRTRAGRQTPKRTHIDLVKQIDPNQLAKRQKHFEVFVIVALLAFGAYHSILYFGHKIVPTSDFPDLFKVGRDILSFQLPSRFKQAPVLGMLQFILSHFVGGQHPPLTAGWLLNAILHPFNLILLWLVAKRIVGKSALWFAIIAILSPWVMRMLTDPLVETTLLFFILLTFHFIFKRSNWSYLFASITTMVRYEGAALIMAAFVMDVIYSTSRRQKLRAFAYSAMASVPLAIWLLATALTWYSPASKTHYLTLFGSQSWYSKLSGRPPEDILGFTVNMRVLWQTGFQPLLTPYPRASADFADMLGKLSKVLAVSGFFFGSVWGLFKRRWEILALLIFFVPYFVVHARIPAPLMRYYTPVFWIALLICWFGLQGAWQIINKNQRVPVAVVTALQILILVVAGVWLFRLLPFLPKISTMSPRSASVPYVALGLAALILGVRIFAFKPRRLLQNTVILTVFALLVVSNQFMLVRMVGDGQKDKEFKQLARWYIDNAKPGEKLGVNMAGEVRIFAPDRAEYIIRLPQADSPQKFIEACYENDITYVVWATREGLSKDHPGYRVIGLDKNITLLGKPRSIGPYEFIDRVGWKRGWVHIFRLRGPAAVGPGPPPGS